MIKFQFFPRSIGITSNINQVIQCFKCVETEIDSMTSNLKSNEVLKLIQPHLEKLCYRVELGKGKDEKIDVPVLFGILLIGY